MVWAFSLPTLRRRGPSNLTRSCAMKVHRSWFVDVMWNGGAGRYGTDGVVFGATAVEETLIISQVWFA